MWRLRHHERDAGHRALHGPLPRNGMNRRGGARLRLSTRGRALAAIAALLPALTLPAAAAPQGSFDDGAEVEVTASVLLRVYGSNREEIAYVEATMFGTFFERDRAEELTIKLAPEGTRYEFDYRILDNPWWALRNFRGGAMEFYRGALLLARVRDTASWIEIEGISRSRLTGLLNVHVLLAENRSSRRMVSRYFPATGQLELLPYVADGSGPPGMDCGPEERPFPGPDDVQQRTVIFRPCRSLVD